MATIRIMGSKVAGGGSTPSPMTIAAIIRGGAQALSPTMAASPISIIMKTAPVISPASMPALRLRPRRATVSVVLVISSSRDIRSI